MKTRIAIIMALVVTNAAATFAITRDQIISTADSYESHTWTCRTGNADANYNKFTVGVTYSRVSYNWGGNDTLSSFDSKIAAGTKAGDCIECVQGVSRPAWAGVDCSGFIQRCWQIPGEKLGTWGLAESSVSTRLSSRSSLKKGDILLRAGVHVQLFDSFTPETQQNWVYEANTPSADNPYGGVCYKIRAADNTYLPYKYNNVVEDTGQPDLTIVEPVTFSPASVAPGGTIDVYWTEKNKGTAASSPAYNTKLSLSSSAYGTTYQIANFEMPTLGAGVTASRYSGPYAFVPLSIPPGDYYVTAFIDCNSLVTEGNETDNIGSSSPNKITITASAQAPTKATNPGPVSGATGQSISSSLSWANGGAATSYDVYFNGQYKGNQSGTSYNPETLSYSTYYSWRIDARNSTGVTTGDTWTFTTGSAADYTITTISSPSAGGTTSGGGPKPKGTIVTLTASANSGYTFVNWTENGYQVSTNNSCTLTANDNRTLVANFTQNLVYTTLTMNGSTVNGDISTVGEEDWYQFTVSAAGSHTIETWLDTLWDNVMYLYGPNSQTSLITTNDDKDYDGQDYAARIVTNLSTGTYYVKIQGYDPTTDTGTYTIQVTGGGGGGGGGGGSVSYIVSFDAQGGSVSPGSATVTSGSTYGTLPTPARTGYTFGGWYTGANGTGSSVTSSTAVTATSNHPLYAKWTANSYTVAYNGNGSTGGSTASSSHTYDVSKVLTANGFTRTGYTFAGWATTAGGTAAYSDGQSVVSLSSTQSATVTLYAKWIPITYALTVNNGTGGGTAYTNQQRVAISATVPSGKRFDRWLGATQYVDSVTSAETYVTMPAFAITLTATNKPIAMPWLNLLLE